MYVDPNTGVPQVEPRSMAGAYGTSVGQGANVQNPLFYDMMESIPPASTTIAWNMGRVRNTLLNNNRFQSLSAVQSGGIRQTFSPLRFRSLADVSNIDPRFVPQGRTSPIGISRRPTRRYRRNRLSKLKEPPVGRYDPRPGGFITTERRRTPKPLYRERMAGRFTGDQYGPPRPKSTRVPREQRPGYTPFQLSDILNDMYGKTEAGKALAANNQRMFAPGALGTFSTTATLMAGAASDKQLNNFIHATRRFAGDMNIGNWSRTVQTGRVSALPGALEVNRGTVAAFGHMNIRFANAKFTGRAMGYVSGAQAARKETLRAANWAMANTGGLDNFFAKGVAEGAESWAEKRIGARIAGSALTAGAARLAGPIGWALLAKDFAEFGGKMVGRGIKLSIDAVQSAQGDLSKRGPGLGYTDNSVAATSRQRGVMAISNSRLNARSALGTEAAMMYQMMG